LSARDRRQKSNASRRPRAASIVIAEDMLRATLMFPV
jgi:hypothetical protein